MVARGDAVLIGLVGFMALYIGGMITLRSGSPPGPLGPVVLITGIVLFGAAIALYRAAEPSPWIPNSGPGRRPLVTLACPVYGTPLAWVDEVSQWYCATCQAYHGAKPG